MKSVAVLLFAVLGTELANAGCPPNTDYQCAPGYAEMVNRNHQRFAEYKAAVEANLPDPMQAWTDGIIQSGGGVGPGGYAGASAQASANQERALEQRRAARLELAREELRQAQRDDELAALSCSCK